MSNYFDLHTTGIGYLNRIREVRPKSGTPFWACDIAALHGLAGNVDYTRFDCRVSGTKAIGLVEQYKEAVDKDRKVLIGFRLSDLWADTFTYSNDDRAGEIGVSLKARLLYIGWIKVDGENVYSANSEPDNGQESGSHDSDSQSGPAPEPEATALETSESDSDRMPAEVRLTKDDPDFLERKAALKEQGYRFDGQAKVWRLPHQSTAAA